MMIKNLTSTLLNFELFHSTLRDEEKKQERLNIWRRNRLRGCVININTPGYILSSESIATLFPFGTIEGNKWFVQISSQ